MVERMTGSHEVEGSSPFSSTYHTSSSTSNPEPITPTMPKKTKKEALEELRVELAAVRGDLLVQKAISDSLGTEFDFMKKRAGDAEAALQQAIAERDEAEERLQKKFLGMDEMIASGEKYWPGHWMIHMCDTVSGIAVHSDKFH